MEHFFHIFIPGTPENIALAASVPFWGYVTFKCRCWYCTLRGTKDQTTDEGTE